MKPKTTPKSKPKPKPKPITYLMTVQCVRSEIGVVAEYVASTPFPTFKKGDSLQLIDCDPVNWKVTDVSYRIVTGNDGSVISMTWLFADSGTVENTGFIVKKQSGKEVGPSPTRFGRIKEGDLRPD